MKKKTDTLTKLTTRWGQQVLQNKDKEGILSEYPRPVLERNGWQCLNGLWNYAFTQGKEEPGSFEGEILVPFAPETRLSGVEKQLLPGSALWYERKILFSEETKEKLFGGGRLLLHFGAVDQTCEVWIDGKKVGGHKGGYLPFTLDITDFLKDGKAQGCTIRVRVEDVSDTSFHSVGKQTLTPGGMYYPATGGIWQTVWLEAVPSRYLAEVEWQSDYDEGTVTLKTKIVGEKSKNGEVLLIQFPNGEYPDQKLFTDGECKIALPGFRSWSPEEPYLYQVRVTLFMEEGQEALDKVKSYFAMRKCVVTADKAGVPRIFLNNRPCVQVGVLDQGYWPESMYTAPSDEAMIYDIESIKELGFTMLRKHVKVEPARWYYHCDRLGMLVWQDMINGGRKNKSWYVTYLATLFGLLGIAPSDRHPMLLSRQDKAGREEYEQELKELVSFVKKYPCVVCLVPFNEGWGQFETEKMPGIVKEMAPGLLVDQASGWFDMGGGDFKSIHYYFFKLKFKREKRRALALTEFGGYANKVPGHTMHEKEYGYKTFSDRKQLEEGYEQLMRETVLPAVKEGICATVYTQLSDVEEEINGIFTYDREVLKMDAEVIRRWNEALKRGMD